ncbi:MAG: zf-HC2 domain-containing protein [Bryobacteraceae bacterium]|jgi:anti-sigma factor RsiW
MSCAKFETDMALYAGGDLPNGRIARIEAHLAECADCRALTEELRALLSELRSDPLEDTMVAQVRQRVMAEVSAATRRPSRLYWKLAFAAALVLAAVLAWPWHSSKHVPVAPIARAEPSHVTPPPVNIVPARHRVVRRRRHAPVAQSGPPLLVQFVTDNPNIVIYWLIDQKQGD